MAESPDTPKRPESAIRLGNGVWTMPEDLRYAFTRSGGPGGQNVNKVSTKVELRVRVTDLRRFGAFGLIVPRGVSAKFFVRGGCDRVAPDQQRAEAQRCARRHEGVERPGGGLASPSAVRVSLTAHASARAKLQGTAFPICL